MLRKRKLTIARLVSACACFLMLNAERADAQDFARSVLTRASQATVRIVSFAEDGSVLGTGTGVIIDRRGYVLTNFHVVGATRLGRAGAVYSERVRVDTVADTPSPLQATFIGTVVGGNAVTDLALIRITARLDGGRLPQSFPFLPMDRSGAEPGESIAALGYPSGVQSIEVTYGHVTNVIQTAAATPAWLRLDARINPGSSGGPIIDRRGRVVGLATLLDNASAQTVEVARPIQVIPDDWIEVAGNTQPLAYAVGVPVIGHDPHLELAIGLTTPFSADLLYYRVPQQGSFEAVTDPALPMRVVDASGATQAEGLGVVRVQGGRDVRVEVFVEASRFRATRFAIGLRPAPVREANYIGYVQSSTLTGVNIGDECSVSVRPSTSLGMECRIMAQCGSTVIYGAGNTGYNYRCETDATDTVLRVNDPFDNDGDPAMTFDLPQGRVDVRSGRWLVSLGAQPPLPETPSDTAVRQRLSAAAENVRRCGSGASSGTVRVMLTISGSGAVDAVEVTAFDRVGGASTMRCVEQVLRGLSFPTFRRPIIRVAYEYTLGRQPDFDEFVEP